VSPPIVVLTPNLSGSDGVSRLARLVTSTFDNAIVVALHEAAATTTFGGARVRGGDGRSSRRRAIRAPRSLPSTCIWRPPPLHSPPVAPRS
jgi:hypothetical protein